MFTADAVRRLADAIDDAQRQIRAWADALAGLRHEIGELQRALDVTLDPELRARLEARLLELRAQLAQDRTRAISSADSQCDACSLQDRVAAAQIEQFRTLVARLGGETWQRVAALLNPGGGTSWSLESLRDRARQRAGVTNDAWNSRTPAAADASLQKLYDEGWAGYAHGHPELAFAALAALAGGPVYAGFQDLSAFAAKVSPSNEPGEADGWAIAKGPLATAAAAFVHALRSVGAEALRSAAASLPEMQRAIWEDLAPQHEAYAIGGIAAVRELVRTGELPAQVLFAWEDIASGDPARVERGNRALVMREQHDVVQQHWDALASGPDGATLVKAMSLVAASPVPGARSFHESQGLTANISDFAARWRWIEGEILPAMAGLCAEPARRARALAEPVAARARAFRMLSLPYEPA